MKSFTAWVLTAGLVLVTAGAQAQTRAPYVPVSDVNGPYVGGPYAAMPPEPPRPGYGYGPTLLPPTEVYTVARENGFSPLGIPRQRGFVYAISVIDRRGDQGRLIIDARNGRIIRFVSGPRIGGYFNDELTLNYGQPPEPIPPVTPSRAGPRPPASIPRVASRTVPVPKASPMAARPATAPEAVQQSAAVQPKQVEAQTPPVTVTTGSTATKPVPQTVPTQDMPKAQGLE
jgi:hypothetical protein